MANSKRSRSRKKKRSSASSGASVKSGSHHYQVSKGTQRKSLFDRLARFVEGDPSKSVQREGYFAKPLAPAPTSVFIVVVVACGVLLAVSAGVFKNDYVAAFSCFLVLAPGAAILDITGRREAAQRPNSAYKPNGLPTSPRRYKVIFVVSTLLVLVGWVSAHVKQGEDGPRLPYFYAVAAVFMVMPQLLARLEMRRRKVVEAAADKIPKQPEFPDSGVFKGKGGATFYR